MCTRVLWNSNDLYDDSLLGDVSDRFAPREMGF